MAPHTLIPLVLIWVLVVAGALALGGRRAAKDNAAAPKTRKRRDRKNSHWQPHEPVPRQLPVAGGPFAPVDLISMQPAPKRKRGIELR